MTILSGQQIVSSGQTVSGIAIDGGALWIMSGGTATATAINKGQEIVEGAGSQTVVGSAGALAVKGGGKVQDTQVYNGGVMEVDYRSFAYDTTVHYGGIEILSNSFFPSGGDAGLQSAGLVLKGGTLIVGAYATMEDVTVESGAEIVFEGKYGGAAKIEKGADVIYADVKAGHRQTGGVITYFSQTVHSGGIVDRALIRAGGQLVASGGRVFDETLKLGSLQQVHRGGRAFQITVLSGSRQTVVGSATSAIIGNGAEQFVSAGGVATDTVVSRGGVQYVDGSHSMAVNTEIDGGTEEVLGDATAQSVRFTTSGGLLFLDASFTKSIAVHGFSATNKIDLIGFDIFNMRLSFHDNAKNTGGALTITDGSLTTTVSLFGQYVAAGFHKSGAGVNGVAISYRPPTAAAELVAPSIR